MYIKLKGKHIIILCVTLIAIIGTAFSLGDDLYRQGFKLAEVGQMGEARQVLLQAVDDDPLHKDAARALYWVANGGMPTHRQWALPANAVLIFPGGRMWSGDEQPHISWQETAALYERIVENYPQSPWTYHSLRCLAELHILQANYQTAEAYAKAALDVGGSRQYDAYRLWIEALIKQGEYQVAMVVIDEMDVEEATHSPLERQFLRAKVLVGLKRYQEAQDILRQLPELARTIFEEMGNRDLPENAPSIDVEYNITIWERKIATQLQIIERLQHPTKPDLLGSVKGRILSGSRPLDGVSVYLLRDYDGYGMVNTHELLDLPRVVTDSLGNYQFDSLPAGEYGLALVISKDAVKTLSIKYTNTAPTFVLYEGDNAVDNIVVDIEFFETVALVRPLEGEVIGAPSIFEWVEVPGASYYSLYVGVVTEQGDMINYNLMPYQVTTDTRLVVDMSRPHAIASVQWDTKGVNPISLLGTMKVGGTISWGVVAYDEGGNVIASSVSSTDRPVAVLESSLTTADTLLLERKYAEAIAAYEAATATDPQDLHALLMLARLYRFGVSMDDAEWGRGDLEQAIPYYQQYLSIQDHAVVREELAQALWSAGQHEKAREQYLQVLETEQASWGTYYILGLAEFRLGNGEGALEAFDGALTMPHSHQLPKIAASISLLQGDVERALTYARHINAVTLVDSLENYKEVVDNALLEPFFALVTNGQYNQAQTWLAGQQPPMDFYEILLPLALGEMRHLEANTALRHVESTWGTDYPVHQILLRQLLR